MTDWPKLTAQFLLANFELRIPRFSFLFPRALTLFFGGRIWLLVYWPFLRHRLEVLRFIIVYVGISCAIMV